MKKLLDSLKTGFQNVNMVIAEGNFKILLKPIIVMAAICGGLYYYNGGNDAIINKTNAEIRSERTQREKMVGYEKNKERVTEVEKYFPEIVGKNEWLVTEVIETFSKNNMPYSFTGSQIEEQNDTFIATSIGVSFSGSYADAGKIIAALETRNKYFKIYDISVQKDEQQIGTNKYTIKVGTVFPKERLSGSAEAGAGKAARGAR
ncbi:hypothetical protein AAIR98_000992 [Elusimicrobium simillimum]|uniref:hypothetical protein n=1 Tax=Elusimicrobium simillimum TaxID=3143438 RepID=UPI003C700698